MRARFIRSGRVTARGRYLVPVSAAAAVALAAGTVVAINPVTQSDDIALTQSANLIGGGQASATATAPAPTVGAEFSYSIVDLAKAAGYGELAAGIDFSKVTFEGLPDGVIYDPATGVISGTPTKAGSYTVVIKLGGNQIGSVNIVVGAEGTTDGNIGGNVGGGADANLGSLGEGPMADTIQQLLISLGLSGTLASGSLGGSTPTSPAPESPTPESPAPESPAPESPAPESPAPNPGQGTTNSLGNSNIDLSSLATLIPGLAGSTGNGEATATPVTPTPGEGTVDGGSLGHLPGGMGSGGEATPTSPTPAPGQGNGESLTNLGSSTLPGSSANGSADALIPGLAITGTLLLGLALLAALANGSSVPTIPGMGSSGPAGSTGPGPVSGPHDSGSTGSSVPVAAAPEQPAPAAPGPDVNNGRG